MMLLLAGRQQSAFARERERERAACVSKSGGDGGQAPELGQLQRIALYEERRSAAQPNSKA